MAVESSVMALVTQPATTRASRPSGMPAHALARIVPGIMATAVVAAEPMAKKSTS